MEETQPSTKPMEKMKSFYELFPYPNRPLFVFPNVLNHLGAHGGVLEMLSSPKLSFLIKQHKIFKEKNLSRQETEDLSAWYEQLNKNYNVNKRILLVGCGTDEPLLFRMLHPKNEIVAVDISKKNISIAERKIFLLRTLKKFSKQYFAPVDFINGAALPVLQGKVAGKFDYVQCFGFLHHQTDVQGHIESLAECLNPGGHLRIMVYSYHGRRLERKIQKKYQHLWDGFLDKSKTKKDILKSQYELFSWQVLNFLNLNKTTSHRFRYLGLNLSSVADALMHPSDPGLPLENIMKMAHEAELKLVYCEALIEDYGRIYGFQNPQQTWDTIVKADRNACLLSNPILVFRKGS